MNGNAGCGNLSALPFIMLNFLLDVASPAAGEFTRLWQFLPFGYLATVAVELPILYFLLPGAIGARARAATGFWLTACTYPVVVLVLPALMFGFDRITYLVVAETFAPAAECVLFWLAFRGRDALDRAAWVRSFLVITVANLASFGIGEVLNWYLWSGWF